jgi:signal transduction histidine kinase
VSPIPTATFRRLPGRAGNAFVWGVARAPAKLRTKLLVGFLGIAALLVLIALLGLRVLGQSNTRAERLGALQVRVVGYQRLEANAAVLRQVLALCTGTPDYEKFLNGGRASPGAAPTCLRSIRQPVDAVVALLGSATQLGFKPAPDEAVSLRQIKRDYGNLKQIVGKIAGSGAQAYPLHARAENLSVDLEVAARTLAETATNKTNALIAQNRSSYRSSRDLFIGVAAGTVGLALLLGLVLSWALVGPIQRTEARLAEIAGGDFSGRLDVPNRDELGALAANLNRMNDELRRLYGELETASRHKSEFLANMSHELRTPLNAIIGFSELLQQQELVGDLNERQTGYVEDVLDAGRHLLSLINDILDLSKVEAGKMELDLGDVALRPTLESGLAMHADRASSAGMTLALTLDPDEITIRADERKLRQVVFNLVSNAVKFTPPKGRVDVSARLNGGVVEVAVTDTGPGIDPEDQELIFEEFRQARSDSGGRTDGTGLGLPLSRKFVELHGGRLWVESLPGKGSSFRFTLPVEQVA